MSGTSGLAFILAVVIYLAGKTPDAAILSLIFIISGCVIGA